MNTVRIESGICGFKAAVRVTTDSKEGRCIVLESECEQVMLLGRNLNEIRLDNMIQGPINQNPVYQIAGRCHLHPSCPVPCGIIKAVEVALGVALPKEVRIEVHADNHEQKGNH